jgi:tetratricopeptide (TPR) repeat protein
VIERRDRPKPKLWAPTRNIGTLLARADQCVQAGRPREAVDILLRALAIDPRSAEVRHRVAGLLLDTDRAGEALPHAERLHASDPKDRTWATMLATAWMRVGQYRRAAELYGILVAGTPNDANLWLTYGSVLRHAGKQAEAIDALRKCIALAPQTGAAYLAIQNINSDGISPAEISLLESQADRPGISALQRSHLHYALGRVGEKHADFAASFDHYANGAKLRRATFTYDAGEVTDQVSRLIMSLTPEFFATRQGCGHPDAAPIFIIGMPRAGSTLIEQILSSHSAVEGTMELPELANAVRALTDLVAEDDTSAFPDRVQNLTAAQLAAAGARYVDRVRPYRQAGKPMFIDKMPANWLHAGIIHLILPNAKIIDARRGRMATCFSAFIQDFATGQRFSYDFRELAQYYRDYVRLMHHFDVVLPGRIHRVNYESLVGGMAAEVRRLLDYCGLQFEPACLEFWRNGRAVSTASAEQVRRPLYSDSIDSWRRFEPFLAPLKAALDED